MHLQCLILRISQPHRIQNGIIPVLIFFVMEHRDGLHSTMSELMKRQKCLMMKCHHIIFSEYLQLKVIHQNHSAKGL